jgi:hypothetical protein
MNLRYTKNPPNLPNYGNMFDVTTPIFSKCRAGTQHVPFNVTIFDHQQI